MQINPNLTGAQNIIALATDPIFTAPTDPNNIGVGTPFPFSPLAQSTKNAVNVDGDNSNTYVMVYLRPVIEDVIDDGSVQKVIYERVTIESIIGESPTVALPSGLSIPQVVAAALQTLGLVDAGISLLLTGWTENAPTLNFEVPSSNLLYLPTTFSVAATYSD
jgi:hypothetical protein